MFETGISYLKFYLGQKWTHSWSRFLDNFSPWVARCYSKVIYLRLFFIYVCLSARLSFTSRHGVLLKYKLDGTNIAWNRETVLNFNRTCIQANKSCLLFEVIPCTVKLYKQVLFVADVNECQTGQAVCEAGEKCVNILGSYACVCAVGTTGPECSISE